VSRRSGDNYSTGCKGLKVLASCSVGYMYSTSIIFNRCERDSKIQLGSIATHV